MKTISSDTCSQAIRYFEENTKLRRSKKRAGLVEMIGSSPRPILLAEKLLDVTGRNVVAYSDLEEWFTAFVRKHGAPDPVFNQRLTDAAKNASQDRLTVSEFEELKSVLKASWAPWAIEDRENHRELLNE